MAQPTVVAGRIFSMAWRLVRGRAPRWPLEPSGDATLHGFLPQAAAIAFALEVSTD